MPEPARAREVFVPDLGHLARFDHRPLPIAPSVHAPHLLTDQTRQQFLGDLRQQIHAAAEQELAGSGWTAEHCPYIAHWFGHYDRRGAGDIEAALRRYAPGATAATTANEYLPFVVDRVRLAIQRWRSTAAIDAPTLPALDTPSAVEARFPDAKPLPSAVRTQMEGAFERNLGDVRVHTTGQGLGRVGETSARALAVGQTIVFGDRQFAPTRTAGQLLLAHELAHTQQQSRAKDTTSPVGADEARADDFAVAAVGRARGLGMPLPAVGAKRGLSLRRCSAKTSDQTEDLKIAKPAKDSGTAKKAGPTKKPAAKPSQASIAATAEIVDHHPSWGAWTGGSGGPDSLAEIEQNVSDSERSFYTSREFTLWFTQGYRGIVTLDDPVAALRLLATVLITDDAARKKLYDDLGITEKTGDLSTIAARIQAARARGDVGATVGAIDQATSAYTLDTAKETGDYSHVTFEAAAKGHKVEPARGGLENFERWTIDGHEMTIAEVQAAGLKPSTRHPGYTGWRWIEIDQSKGFKQADHGPENVAVPNQADGAIELIYYDTNDGREIVREEWLHVTRSDVEKERRFLLWLWAVSSGYAVGIDDGLGQDPGEIGGAPSEGRVAGVRSGPRMRDYDPGLREVERGPSAPVPEPGSRGDVNGDPVANEAAGEINVEPKPDIPPPAISPKHGYQGEWPPPIPGPRPGSTATDAEMADWRYQRYVRNQFDKGKQANEILTPEGYEPHAKTAATPGARPGRGGGDAQKGVREGPAAAAGYKNTETSQLGERWNPKKQRMEKNMVDGTKPSATGGTDYLEVDTINKDGLPHAGYRDKLKTEIDALKPGDSLEFWDKTDPSRRIRYEYGDKPSEVDTRKAKK